MGSKDLNWISYLKGSPRLPFLLGLLWPFIDIGKWLLIELRVLGWHAPANPGVFLATRLLWPRARWFAALMSVVCIQTDKDGLTKYPGRLLPPKKVILVLQPPGSFATCPLPLPSWHSLPAAVSLSRDARWNSGHCVRRGNRQWGGPVWRASQLGAPLQPP